MYFRNLVHNQLIPYVTIVALQLRIAGPIHLAHPTLADEGGDVIRAEASTWCQGHGFQWICEGDYKPGRGLLGEVHARGEVLGVPGRRYLTSLRSQTAPTSMAKPQQPQLPIRFPVAQRQAVERVRLQGVTDRGEETLGLLFRLGVRRRQRSSGHRQTGAQ